MSRGSCFWLEISSATAMGPGEIRDPDGGPFGQGRCWQGRALSSHYVGTAPQPVPATAPPRDLLTPDLVHTRLLDGSMGCHPSRAPGRRCCLSEMDRRGRQLRGSRKGCICSRLVCSTVTFCISQGSALTPWPAD